MKLNKILDKFFEYCVNSNIIYYDSINSYYSRKEPTLSRKIKFYLRFFIFVIFTIKYSLLLLYPEKLQGTLLTDITIIFGNQVNLVHALMLGLGIQVLLIKLTIAYYEARKNLKVIDMFMDFKARKPMYQISHKHLKKITLRAFLIYYGYIRITGSLTLYIGSIIEIFATVISYLYLDYGNVITLWLWTILLIMTINEILIVVLVGAFLFYIPIMLLNYRFDELMNKL